MESYGALDDALSVVSVGYLFERLHERQLRLERVEKGTAIAISQLADEERGLLLALRSAFVQVLQQKAIWDLAKEYLSYYDHKVSNQEVTSCIEATGSMVEIVSIYEGKSAITALVMPISLAITLAVRDVFRRKTCI
jgi:hypothetical protein